MNIRHALAASALMVVSAASAAHASPVNLLANGGFENDQGITTSYYNIGNAPGTNNVGPDHAVPSDFAWSVSNGNVDIISYQTYGPAPVGGGNFGLDLVGYGSTGTISQDISTVVGQRYSVSFQYENNWQSINDPTAGLFVNIGSNNALVQVGNSVTPTLGQGSWQTFTDSFVATDAVTTIELAEIFGDNNGGVFLDNVSVTAATAVPEPATWAMTLLGLFGMGLVMLGIRRKSAKA